MCGICMICTFGISDQELQSLSRQFEKCLQNRGPDCFRTKYHGISEQVKCAFLGSVLWLQGECVTPQPVTDGEGNVLLWNGDVLDGLQFQPKESDTQFLFDQLRSCNENQLVTLLGKIIGPWSMVFNHTASNRLYFGRDILGRHSLLWKFPSVSQKSFIVTSVAPKMDGFIEVPAIGLYYVNLRDVFRAESSITLIPWMGKKNVSVGPIDFISLNVRTDLLIPNGITCELNRELPSDNTQFLLTDSVPEDTSLEYGTDHFASAYRAMPQIVDQFVDIFTNAIRRRVHHCPPKCLACTEVRSSCLHSQVAVLFSGGLDSAVIALLIDDCLASGLIVDLINVAFEIRPIREEISKRKKKLNQNCMVDVQEMNGVLSEEGSTKEKWKSISLNEYGSYEVPDRISGRMCWEQLKKLRPHRNWNFVEVNVCARELSELRNEKIANLVSPHNSVLDDSVGCALWFACRGKSVVKGREYTSPARVVLCGIGADEQLGGYSRHRSRFRKDSWSGLLEEMELDFDRIHSRNLGRDDRVLADHGRAPRFPFLDEDVVSFLNCQPVWLKCQPLLPRGIGEKYLLRVAAHHLGLGAVAQLPKRAIQFGTRLAKMENNKEKGSDVCTRLVNLQT